MRLKGDLNVNGKRVRFDDSIDVAMPHPRRLPHASDLPGFRIDSDDAIVRMGTDIVIDSSEVVDDAVVSLFGNVTVRGRVGGDVVAVLGSIRLEPGSVVDGDAVAVGGALDQASDATVHGQSISLSFLPIRAGIPPLRALAIALFLAWVLAMVAGGLLALLFPRRLTRVAQAVSERTGWALLFGILLPPLAVIAGVLLMVTVIGIPVAFLLPLVYLFTLWMGTVASTYLLGCRAARRELGMGLGLPLLLGTLIVGVLFGFGAVFAGVRSTMGTLGLFFPLLGVLLATSLSVIGSGAVIVSRFGSQPRQPAAAPAPYAGATPGTMPPSGASPLPPATI
jgi:MFS family permease